MDQSPLWLGAAVLILVGGQLSLLWHLRRAPLRTPPAPPEPSYSSDDFYQLRTQVQALERQVQDVELTIEARHRKVCGMIAGERGAAMAEGAEAESVADRIRDNLSGDGAASTPGPGARQRLRKRR